MPQKCADKFCEQKIENIKLELIKNTLSEMNSINARNALTNRQSNYIWKASLIRWTQRKYASTFYMENCLQNALPKCAKAFV